MPTIKSKKTGEEFPVSQETWNKYGEQDLQKNFRVTKKDEQPTEVAEEEAASTKPKRLARTSGENAE